MLTVPLPRAASSVSIGVAACCLLALGVSSCSKKPSNAGAKVTIVLADGAAADCAALTTKASAEPEQRTALVPFTSGSKTLVAALLADNPSKGPYIVTATGYVGPCDGLPVLNVESKPVTVSLVQGEIVSVTVTLDQLGLDSDKDGYRAASVGGPDCRDDDPLTRPGITEVCNDGVDNNCDGKADCADLSACGGAFCSDGLSCSTADRCAGGACVGTSTCTAPQGACERSLGRCETDGGCSYELLDAGAPCRVGSGICTVDGQCAPPGSEIDCGNGLDDNSDGLVDCADPTCLNQPCNDGLGCQVAERCVAVDAGACRGTPKSCNAPPGPCFTDAGTCLEPTGNCRYSPTVGRSCNDLNACTLNDVCGADGGCGFSAMVSCMQSTNQCTDAVGVCVAPSGSCQFAPRAGACDDGNPCTHSDSCQGGGCIGTPYSCTTPPNDVCFAAAGSCNGSGGCTYVPSTGQTCDGGVGICQADGGCQVNQNDAGFGFPYKPSNFDPTTLVAAPSQGLIINCAATYNSTTNSWSGGCANGAPMGVNAPQSNGPNLMVIPLQSLSVTSGGSLTLVGTFPVMFLVFGPVDIAGQIVANSTRGQAVPGAGANSACAAAQTGNNGMGNNRGGGGGGGGKGSSGTAGSAAGGNSGGQSGTADSNAELAPIVAGCNGGASGGGSIAAGGDGGGAVQISSAGLLRVAGLMTVSGAGGSGGIASGGGGGGGGSGGAILLEAMQLQIAAGARLIANGGGGGQGAGSVSAGGPGGDGSSDATAATGGNGVGPGGTGGTGATGTVDAGPAGSPANNNGGGGGGGGGVGRIRLNAKGGGGSCAVDNTAVLSAAVSKPPPCP